MAGLFSLIAPLDREAFFETHWERAPLHLARGDEDFYQSLLTPREVDDAIEAGGLRYPAIQLARGGGFLPAEAFTRSLRLGNDVFTGIPDLDRVRTEYDQGATISLPGFQRSSRALGVLVAAMQDEFSHPVHANVYITPGGAAGFAPHYDTHEVFVLQIAGRKRWRVEPPLLALPHRSQPFDPRRHRPASQSHTYDLMPGDLLYLPRGFVHSTETEAADFSLHVTLGVSVFTWIELLTDWAQSSRGSEDFRRGLPPGFADSPAVRREVAQEFRRLAARLESEIDTAEWLEDFALRVRASAQASRGRFSIKG